jgi:hypothetical protein
MVQASLLKRFLRSRSKSLFFNESSTATLPEDGRQTVGDWEFS